MSHLNSKTECSCHAHAYLVKCAIAYSNASNVNLRYSEGSGSFASPRYSGERVRVRGLSSAGQAPHPNLPVTYASVSFKCGLTKIVFVGPYSTRLPRYMNAV